MAICDFCGKEVDGYYKLCSTEHYYKNEDMSFGDNPIKSCEECIGRAVMKHDKESDEGRSAEVVLQFVREEERVEN